MSTLRPYTTARAFREADGRLKSFLELGYKDGEHVNGTLRTQLEAEVGYVRARAGKVTPEFTS
jgi:hypothetical protein